MSYDFFNFIYRCTKTGWEYYLLTTYYTVFVSNCESKFVVVNSDIFSVITRTIEGKKL